METYISEKVIEEMIQDISDAFIACCETKLHSYKNQAHIYVSKGKYFSAILEIGKAYNYVRKINRLYKAIKAF